jgi:hypothetical protein
MDLERCDRLLADGDRITSAQLVSLGVNDPRKLQDEASRYQARIGAAWQVERAFAQAKQELERLRRGKAVTHGR